MGKSLLSGRDFTARARGLSISLCLLGGGLGRDFFAFGLGNGGGELRTCSSDGTAGLTIEGLGVGSHTK